MNHTESSHTVHSLTQKDTISFHKVDEYVTQFTELVEMERAYEMRQYEEEIRNLSGRKRQNKGRALLNMKGKDEGEGLGGYLVKFVRQKRGRELGDTEISVGDLVMVSKQDPLRNDNPTGTVTEKTNYSLTVVFDSKPHRFVYGRGIRVDLYVNDITFQRMKSALTTMKRANGRLGELRDILLGLRDPSKESSVVCQHWYNPSLNEPQQRAVEEALAAEDIYLIHGPPGTGKTTTLIEVIQQLVEEEKTVLATADSNIAVDNILDFLVGNGVNAVRVGHPARVTPILREHTLDNMIEENSTYQKSVKLRDEAFKIKEKQKKYTYPHQKYRRGMSNSYIKRLARQERGSRGVSPHKIKKMARWVTLQEKADDLFEEADRLKRKALDEILNEADVVCATNSTAGSELMEGRKFDVVVIDEATQATEPSCLISLVSAGKIIMAGDHLQLPPTIQSQEAAQKGLQVTLFERMAQMYGETFMKMLTIQYRMHEKIMNFSNREFYHTMLQAHSSVRTHTLRGLGVDISLADSDIREIVDPNEPVVFIDTQHIDAPERTRRGSTSKENRKEAEIVVELAENLLKVGMEEEEVAIISPYDDQVDLITRTLQRQHLEVRTVDGFQGREKETVIISLVRSNAQGNVGFLEDVRRLNVSLTRARRKLVVVGDGSTISSHPVYQRFIEYVDSNGLYISL